MRPMLQRRKDCVLLTNLSRLIAVPRPLCVPTLRRSTPWNLFQEVPLGLRGDSASYNSRQVLYQNLFRRLAHRIRKTYGWTKEDSPRALFQFPESPHSSSSPVQLLQVSGSKHELDTLFPKESRDLYLPARKAPSDRGKLFPS